MIDRILNQNLYALILKILGIGFLIIGTAIFFFDKDFDFALTCLEISFGIYRSW